MHRAERTAKASGNDSSWRSCWPLPPMDFALGLLPGVAHAVSTIVVGYPFDTVKTRLQTGMYKGEWPIARCVRDTLRTEGAASFYRGCSVPMAALLLKRPVEFAIFEEMQRANPLGVADGWPGV